MDFRAEKDTALAILEQERRPKRREAAAVSLRDLASQDESRWEMLSEVFPVLLADRQPQVRRVGIQLAALVLAPEKAEVVLAKHLSDDDEEVRMEAVGQLADQKRCSNRAYFAQVISDSSFRVRFEAARGMATLGHPAGLDVLLQALQDAHLRFRSLEALALLRDERAVEAVRRLFRKWLLPPFEKTQAAFVLAAWGDEEGRSYLFARARKKWSPDRAMAIELLGEVKAGGAFERLCEILANERDICRGAAARGLGRLGDVRAEGLLSRVLADANTREDVRLDAAEGLCRLRLPSATRTVAQSVSSFPSEEARLEVSGMLEEVQRQ